MARPERHTDPDALAARLFADTAGDVRLALPLGLGKANHVANALFHRAAADPSLTLTIHTALTLEPPAADGDMAERFVGPLSERLFAGYPRLAYAEALRGDGLPANVSVHEVFFTPGQWLDVAAAQRAYAAMNYTDAPAYLKKHGVNVLAQLVARPDAGDPARLSLSCNSDITLDLLDHMRSGGGPCALVGEVNGELPFMPGPAALGDDAFDHVLESPAVDFPLFAQPHPPVSAADHAIGLRAAALVPDGGTLQIGIGSIGDAFGAALLMRQQAPALFARTLERLGDVAGAPAPATAPFEAGLYGCSEMFVPAFLPLYRAGVLKRPAADGALLHAAFFVGTGEFYDELRRMPEDERARFRMSPISFVNTLLGDEAGKRRDRRHARFVNNAMMATALGAVVSDALDDGRVVSGVGGQLNFVAQAMALDDARVVMALPATRERDGAVRSRIVWNYGHTTVPRHLRDLVVTEYGVADLWGQSDRTCCARMAAVADARFQPELVRAAQAAGKLEPGFALPRPSANRPERVEQALAPARAEGWCSRYPFGTELTEDEQMLAPALARLKSEPRWRLAAEALQAVTESPPTAAERRALARMGFEPVDGLRHGLARALVLHAMRARD